MDATQGYTLGLDIGIASVGAAVIQNQQILGLYVRTFDKAETTDGESLNKIRRDARSRRNCLNNKKTRLKKLRVLFKNHGLIPKTTPDTFLSSTSPWLLRTEALKRELTPKEWCQVLYHIHKHRGYQSGASTENEEEEEEGRKVLSATGENNKLLASGGYLTAGEMIEKDDKFKDKKRNHPKQYHNCINGSDIAKEHQILFTYQRKFNNPFTSESFEKDAATLLSFRKAALTGTQLLQMVGFCTFEPTEYRTPKACWTAERFIWLSKLNNLKVQQIGEAATFLNEEQFKNAKELLYTYQKVTYKTIRRAIDLPDTFTFIGLRYSEKDPESATFFTAKSYHQIKKYLEDADINLDWTDPHKIQNIFDLLAYAKSVYKEDKEAINYLKQKDIPEDIRNIAPQLSFSGFIHLSKKCLQSILPFLENGFRYDEALQKAGYNHSCPNKNIEKSKYLPIIDDIGITNPVVQRSFKQTCKLINAIIKKHGSPAAIHIETTRELSKSFSVREEIEKKQKDYQKEKLSLIDKFRNEFNSEPKGKQLLKYRLYKQQDAKCLYSLKPIDLNLLFEDDNYAEVDHILPFSRSFDDSLNNKALVLTKENREKGNQTPFEYFGADSNSENWLRYSAYISSLANIPTPKKNNLLRKDFSSNASTEFKSRNLIDTGFTVSKISEHIRNHLLFDNNDTSAYAVVSVSGKITAFLRTRWGLLKEREKGDLHHAIDAAVIASCSNSLIQRITTYSKNKEILRVGHQFIDPETGEICYQKSPKENREFFPAPWHGFREDLINKVKSVRVSRASRKRGTGQIHQASIRSLKAPLELHSGIKTQLQSLSPTMGKALLGQSSEDIETAKKTFVGFCDPRNKHIFDALRKRILASNVGTLSKNFAVKTFKEPLFIPSKKEGLPPQRVNSIRVMQKQMTGVNIREGIADNGSLLRLDFFQKGKKFYAVPLYSADLNKDPLPNKAAVAGKTEDDWLEMDDSYKFLFSLSKNDWIRITNKTGVIEGYYNSFNRSNSSLELRAHDSSPDFGKDGLKGSITFKTADYIEKLHVDILGNIFKAKDEERKPLGE